MRKKATTWAEEKQIDRIEGSIERILLSKYLSINFEFVRFVLSPIDNNKIESTKSMFLCWEPKEIGGGGGGNFSIMVELAASDRLARTNSIWCDCYCSSSLPLLRLCCCCCNYWATYSLLGHLTISCVCVAYDICPMPTQSTGQKVKMLHCIQCSAACQPILMRSVGVFHLLLLSLSLK